MPPSRRGSGSSYARLVEADASASDADAWAHETAPLPPPPFPTREVATAVLLLAAGTTFLTLSAYAVRGRLPGAAPGAGWGFLVLGLLAALPGFYVTRVAYYAARGRPGFSWDDIPRA